MSERADRLISYEDKPITTKYYHCQHRPCNQSIYIIRVSASPYPVWDVARALQNKTQFRVCVCVAYVHVYTEA